MSGSEAIVPASRLTQAHAEASPSTELLETTSPVVVARKILPALHGNIDVSGIQLDGVDNAAGLGQAQLAGSQ